MNLIYWKTNRFKLYHILPSLTRKLASEFLPPPLFPPLQLPCSWVLNAWNSGWKNRCLCLRCLATGADHRPPSSGMLAAKPCHLGMFFFFFFCFPTLKNKLLAGHWVFNCFTCSQAKPLLKKNDIQELVDPFLADDQYNSRQMKTQIQELVDPFLADDHYNSQQMNLLVLSASLCIQRSSILRPQMRQACTLLGNPWSLWFWMNGNLIFVVEHGVQVVEILKGNFSSLEGLKKRGGILPKGPLQRAVSCR